MADAVQSSICDRAYLKAQLDRAVFTPVRAFRAPYLPLLMIYFATGFAGVAAIATEFWIKKSLTSSATELAALAVWLNLPWTMKMVFGELADTVSIMGSQRRAYVYIGASLIASGFLLMWAAASGRLASMSPDNAYRIAAMLMAIGTVMQDVIADAMTTEVVARDNDDGTPREQADVNRDLGMVQVLGRLSMAIGGLLAAVLSGPLASTFAYSTVFFLALIVPVISASGAALVAINPCPQRPIDWQILGGGLAFGAFVLAMAYSEWRFNQELVFLVSMAVVCWMIVRVVGDLDETTKRLILYAAIIIFVFRATPSVGPAYGWFQIDELGFDELFKGHLAQIGALLGLFGIWFFSDAITRQPVARVLFWLTIVMTVLSLPSYGLTLGLHEWTERNFGIGARGIAVIDSAISAPFGELSMIPMLTLIAIYAPEGKRAIWFALMASLMNLALTASSLQTKYLNMVFNVPRGDYTHLPALFATALIIGLVPLAFIVVFGRRLR